MNPGRFYEYALSASLMIVLIGMLVGIWNLGAIIPMFALNATMNLFGIMMEYHNQKTEKTRWTAFVYGSIAGIVPWIVIVIYFLSAISSADADPPGCVYAIIPTILYFSTSLQSIWFCNQKRLALEGLPFGERVYIILSLLAKTALACQIFAGTLAPV